MSELDPIKKIYSDLGMESSGIDYNTFKEKFSSSPEVRKQSWRDLALESGGVDFDTFEEKLGFKKKVSTEQPGPLQSVSTDSDVLSGTGSKDSPLSYGSVASLVTSDPGAVAPITGLPLPEDIKFDKPLAKFVANKFPELASNPSVREAMGFYLQQRGHTDEEVADIMKAGTVVPRQKKSIPALEKPDTTAKKDETLVGDFEPELAQGYTPEQIKAQEAAFSEGYVLAKQTAVKPRKDAPKLTSSQEEMETMDFDGVEKVVQEVGDKHKLSPYEKTNLRNRILEKYKSEPAAEKAMIGAELDFKEKFGMAPGVKTFLEQKEVDAKIQEIQDNAYKQASSSGDRVRAEVENMNASLQTTSEQMLAKYQAQVNSGMMSPEQAQSAMDAERAGLTHAYNENLKKIQSRYVKEMTDAQMSAESSLKEFVAGRGNMTKEQQKFYGDRFSTHFQNEESARRKGMEQMFRSKALPEKVLTSLALGTGDLLSSAGGILGKAGFENANYFITKAVERKGEALGETGITADSAFDPDWWIANGARTIPMMVALAPVGMGTGAIAGSTARLLTSAKRFQQLSATVGGGLASWKAETMMEQGLGFQQAIAQGKSEKEAGAIAADIGRLNLATIPLQMMELAPFFNRMPTSVGILLGTTSGAAEEVIQGYATNKAFANQAGKEYTFRDWMGDPEFGPTAVLGAAMSAPFVIGGKINEKNEQTKRNVMTGAIKNLIAQGSYSKASGVVEATFNNGLIDEKTKADFNILIQQAAAASEQTVSVEDPPVRHAADQALIDYQSIQSQAEASPDGPVKDALQAQAETKQAEVQSIISGTSPVYTVEQKGDGAPTVMTQEMMEAFINNLSMVEAVATGDVNVTIRNNPALADQLASSVEKEQKKLAEEAKELEEEQAAKIEEVTTEAVTPAAEEVVATTTEEVPGTASTEPVSSTEVDDLIASGVGNAISKLTPEETKVAQEINITEDEAKRVKSAKPKRTRKSKPIVEAIERETEAAVANNDTEQAEATIQSIESAEQSILEDSDTDESFEKKYGVSEAALAAEFNSRGKRADIGEAYKTVTGKKLEGSDNRSNPKDKENYRKFVEKFASALGKEGIKLKNQIELDTDEAVNIDYSPSPVKPSKKTGIKSLESIVADDDIRQHLESVFVEEGNLIATDAHKLVIIKNKESDPVLINYMKEQYVKSLSKVLGVTEAKKGADAYFDENTKEGLEGKLLHLKTGTFTDNKYPNYKAVIPDNIIESKPMPIQKLIDLANGADKAVRNVKGVNAMIFDLKGFHEMEIGVNPKIFMETLKALQENGAQKVTLGFGATPSRAISIKADNGNYAIVMPVMSEKGARATPISINTSVSPENIDKSIKELTDLENDLKKEESKQDARERRAKFEKEKLRQEKEAANEQIAKGLEGIAEKIGAVKKLSAEDRSTILEDLKNILEGVIKKSGISLKEAVAKIIHQLKFSGNKAITSDDLNYFRRELLGKEKIDEKSKPKRRKKSVNIRAYKGESSDEVKDAIKDLGLEYDVENVQDSQAYAKVFISKFGREKSLQAVRDGSVETMPAAFLYAEVIDDISNEIQSTSDQEKKKSLIAHQAAVIDEFGLKARKGGQFNRALDDVYKSAEFSYMVGPLLSRAEQIMGDEGVPPEDRLKIKTLADELEKINAQIKEQEEIIKGLEAQVTFERMAADILREAKQAPATKKSIADKIRQAKLHRPGTFSAATPASIIWDSAVELTALSWEAGETIVDAVKKGLDYIKNQEWYKSLTDEQKAAREKDFTDYWEKAGLEKPADAPISIGEDGLEIPYSLVKKLVSEGIDNITDLVDEIHEMIVDEFPEITKREVRDAITKYGKQKFPSQKEINKKIAEIKREGQLVSALEDAESGKRPLKSGFQRPKPTDRHRELMRKIKDRIKEIPEDAAEVERKFASAQDRIATALTNRKNDLQRQIDAGAREVRNNKSVEYSEANKILKDEVEALEKELDELVGKKELSHEEKVSRAVKSINKSIADIEEKIATYDFSYGTKKPPISDPRLTALREVKKAKQELLNQMRKEWGEADAHRLKLYKKRTAKEIADMQEKLRTGTVELPEPKEALELDTRAKALAVEKMRVKEEIDKVMEKLKLQNRTPKEVWIDRVADTLNVPRSILASGDLSAMLRQGAILSARHPMMAADAFKKQFEFAFSQEAYDNYNRAIKTSPIYYDMQKAGLYLTFESAKLAAKEEQFMSNAAHKIPLLGKFIKGSERAYTGFLNKLRVDVFMDFYDALVQDGYKGKELEEELKSFAGFINQATGRGNLGKYGNQMAPALNTGFFAPKFVASRFNLLGKVMTGGATMTPRARVEFWKTMGSYVAAGMGMLMLAKMAGAEVEDDPTSSDFGKIRVGNTTYDIWAGLQQVVVLLMRMAPQAIGGGAVKNSTTDERVPLNVEGGDNEKTRGKVLWNFVQSKFSPPANIVKETIFDQENAYDKKFFGYKLADKGDKPELVPMVLSNLSPIWFNDIPEIYSAEGPMAAVTAGAGSFFGVGVQHYEPAINDKIQRDISAAIEKKNKPDLIKGDVTDEINAIRESYKSDPEFSERNFAKAEKEAFILHDLKDKPDWYKDVFYSQNNESKVKIIQNNCETPEEILKSTTELEDLGVISNSVKYQAIGDKDIEKAETTLEQQEFDLRQQRQQLEGVHKELEAGKEFPELTDAEQKKIEDIAKRKAMSYEADRILKMQVANGVRAKYIAERLKGMDVKEQDEFMNGLLKAGALSEEVQEQIEFFKNPALDTTNQ